MGKRITILLAYFVTVIYDFPELEGGVTFTEPPEVGQEFTLPSDGKRARVTSVNHEDLTLTAEPV